MIMTFDAGHLDQLNDYFNGNSFEVRLFTNNISMTEELLLGDFVEAAGGGYLAKTVSGGWTPAVVSGIAQVTTTVSPFVFTGALSTNTTIYGWYLVRGTTVVMADLAAEPFTPAIDGDRYDITITYKGVNYV